MQRARALYSFDAIEPTDLSFKKGDIITVTYRSPYKQWWEGETDTGRMGNFPINYVEWLPPLDIFDAYVGRSAVTAIELIGYKIWTTERQSMHRCHIVYLQTGDGDYLAECTHHDFEKLYATIRKLFPKLMPVPPSLPSPHAQPEYYSDGLYHFFNYLFVHKITSPAVIGWMDTLPRTKIFPPSPWKVRCLRTGAQLYTNLENIGIDHFYLSQYIQRKQQEEQESKIPPYAMNNAYIESTDESASLSPINEIVPNEDDEKPHSEPHSEELNVHSVINPRINSSKSWHTSTSSIDWDNIENVFEKHSDSIDIYYPNKTRSYTVSIRGTPSSSTSSLSTSPLGTKPSNHSQGNDPELDQSIPISLTCTQGDEFELLTIDEQGNILVKDLMDKRRIGWILLKDFELIWDTPVILDPLNNKKSDIIGYIQAVGIQRCRSFSLPSCSLMTQLIEHKIVSQIMRMGTEEAVHENEKVGLRLRLYYWNANRSFMNEYYASGNSIIYVILNKQYITNEFMSPAIIDILLSMHMKEKRFIFLSPQVGPDKKSFYKYRLTPDTYLLYIVEIVENKGLVPLEEIENQMNTQEENSMKTSLTDPAIQRQFKKLPPVPPPPLPPKPSYLLKTKKNGPQLPSRQTISSLNMLMKIQKEAPVALPPTTVIDPSKTKEVEQENVNDVSIDQSVVEVIADVPIPPETVPPAKKKDTIQSLAYVPPLHPLFELPPAVTNSPMARTKAIHKSIAKECFSSSSSASSASSSCVIYDNELVKPSQLFRTHNARSITPGSSTTSPLSTTSRERARSAGDISPIENSNDPQYTHYYTYLQLVNGSLYIDNRQKEMYLSDEEFVEVFGYTKYEFKSLPVWKQNDLKKMKRLM